MLGLFCRDQFVVIAKCLQISSCRFVDAATMPFALQVGELNTRSRPCLSVARPPASWINRLPAAISHSHVSRNVIMPSYRPCATSAKRYASEGRNRRSKLGTSPLRQCSGEIAGRAANNVDAAIVRASDTFNGISLQYAP